MTATLRPQFWPATDQACGGAFIKFRFPPGGCCLACFLALGLLGAPIAGQAGLSFDGTNQYVTFGLATNLGSRQFTLEIWFDWTGGGSAANTGNGGLTAIPLITKLSAEKDGDNRDGNYFLGILPGEYLLAADLEEGAQGAAPGKNHPVTGVTPITQNAWHHAAVTYDGTNWVLFLDGHLEVSRRVGQPPRWDSIQHAALGSALTSTGAPRGYFAGALDEVRIWNYARSASQIASNRFVQIGAQPGLVGRWWLNETGGLIAHDSSGHGAAGTLVNGPVWKSNQRAPADVVTPMELKVINPEGTATLRKRESQRAAGVFRFDPAVADEVEKNFRTNFLLTHEIFLAAMEEGLPDPRGGRQIITNATITQLLEVFQNSKQGFPVDLALATIWFQRKSDAAFQQELVAKLREMMARYVCPNILPKEARVGPATIRVYTRGLSNAAPDIGTLQAQSLSCSRTNLCPLSKAQSDFRGTFPTSRQAMAAYLASLLKENCLFDGELTRQIRARYAESLFSADHYEAGQALVKKGQLIDAGIQAALDELKKQTAANEQQAREAAERLKVEQALQELRERTALSEFKSQHFSQQNRWLFAGLLAVAMTSSLAVWQLARARRRETLLPMLLPQSDQAGADGPSEADWKARALLAEKQAAQATRTIRLGLLSHLAHWLKQRFIRGLIAERSHLLTTQENAEVELAELEARLAKLHAPMEERLNCYRQRITELERELAVKGAESREMIQAKIRLTRKRLEAEERTEAVQGLKQMRTDAGE